MKRLPNSHYEAAQVCLHASRNPKILICQRGFLLFILTWWYKPIYLLGISLIWTYNYPSTIYVLWAPVLAKLLASPLKSLWIWKKLTEDSVWNTSHLALVLSNASRESKQKQILAFRLILSLIRWIAKLNASISACRGFTTPTGPEKINSKALEEFLKIPPILALIKGGVGLKDPSTHPTKSIFS